MTAAHLGDGGEGLLVLRPGDGQQRVGHRDQACSGHCVAIMSHYYCRVESSSESAARGYGISEYSKIFRRGLEIAILHTFLGKTELFHYSYYFEDHHL